MRLYHATTSAHTDAILRDGFRDGPTSCAIGGEERCGVWLADRAMTAADFSVGEAVLVLEIPEAIVAPFEQADDELGLPDGMAYYRAFLVPADVLNRYLAEAVWPGR